MLAGCALLLAALAAPAGADPYGEIHRFSPGTQNSGAAEVFGVDPGDANSVYVGGTAAAKGQFVLKKFSETGTELASVTIAPPAVAGLKEAKGIEGVAIDGKEGRLFVLVDYGRGFHSAVVAGALYAFSTKPVSGKLVPAEGITESTGLFATAATLNATSESHAGTSADPLFSPAGIALDPSTHEVVVLGTDEEQEEKSFPKQPHAALQRVAVNAHAAAGTPAGVLGARYVDPLEGAGSEHPEYEGASSPVVSKEGNVLFAQRTGKVDELVQAPSDFSSASAPKPIYAANTHAETAKGEEIPFESETLLELNPVQPEEAERGAGLSVVQPESGPGKIYGYAKIKEDEVEEGKLKGGELQVGEENAGVLALNFEEGNGAVKASELGWTGGQVSAQIVNGKPQVIKCSVGLAPTPPTVSTAVAAASGEKVFVLGWVPVSEAKNVEVRAPEVLELGPGGEGCNKTFGQINAESEEKPIEKPVPACAAIELSSTVADGSALEAEWNFDEGAPPLQVTTDQHQETELFDHTLTGEGPGGLQPTITEKIHSDDLASPAVEFTKKLSLIEAPPEAIAQPAPMEVSEGGTATFTVASCGGAVKVQWQVKKKGAPEFEEDTTDAGNTTDTLTVKPVTAAQAGNEYRAVLKNGKGKEESNAALLSVKGIEQAPVVTKSPTSIKVLEGASASFEAAATGASSVQWQVKKQGAPGFEPDTTDAGNTTDKLTVEHTTGAESGNEYRAEFKNAGGAPADSAAGKLTVETLAEHKKHEEELKQHEEELKHQEEQKKREEEEGRKQHEAEVQKQHEEEERKQHEAEVQKQHEAEKGGVLGTKEEPPVAVLASTSLSVSSSGKLVVTVKCPTGEASCSGTITLRTLTAVVASVGGHQAKAKAKVLTLASGSFSVGGGQAKAVTLRVSSAALKLLAHSHSLRARATILAKNPSNGTHTTLSTVTLHLAKHGHK